MSVIKAMGQPNIWGSPARDSLLLNRAGSQPFNSLLQSVLQRVPGGEMPGLPANDRISILVVMSFFILSVGLMMVFYGSISNAVVALQCTVNSILLLCIFVVFHNLSFSKF